MTEAEWLACEDREKLQIFLRFHPSAPRVRDFERRLRLYTCGCCRLVWDAYPYDACRHGVEIAEAYADGEADTIALAEARAALQSHPMPAAVLEEVDTPIGRRRRPSGAEWNAHMAAYYATYDPGNPCRVGESQGTGFGASHGPTSVVRAATALGRGAETTRAVTAIFRDIFANPFRPVTFDPAWRSETVVALATGIYADRAFDRLPILADALQDAGCENADILDHCRGSGPHVRGCWVLDLVLDKLRHLYPQFET